MRTAIAFLALVAPVLSELLPPWYPTTQAPASYVNQTWLDSLYPCSAAELAWIKLQTRTGAMSTDHAQHELGCRTAWRDSRNSCTWKELKYIKHNVLTGKLTLHQAKRIAGCESDWVPPTQSPTPAPPTPFPTPVPPTPYPTLHPTPAPTPADYRCIPDFHLKAASATYNREARCCSESKQYFKWDTRYEGHWYCGTSESESPRCVPDAHPAVDGVPCCSGKTHKVFDQQINGDDTVCGDKGTGGLRTPSEAVDCRVSKWSCSAQCSSSCGGGVHHCSRTVTLKSAHGGHACPPLTKQVPCNVDPCPQDCVVGSEHSCSMCSNTCGSGVQMCRRTIVSQPKHGGAACPSDHFMKPCQHAQKCPQDCTVTPWTEWSTCSHSCGNGEIVRTRQVSKDAAHGGVACPALYQLSKCNLRPCPIDCVVSSWEPWTTCTKTCGGGVTSRKRHILQPPVHGGKACVTPEVDTQACNTHTCKLLECHADLAQCKVVPTNGRAYSGFPFAGSRIEITHSHKLFHLGGFFHCHRVGTAECVFELEKGCTGTPGIDPSPIGDKKEGRPSPQQLTGMSEETLQRLTPDKCRCVCDKHPCCKKDQYVLNNVELRGNTFKNVGRWEDCCSLCTNHPGCGGWEYSDRKVCVLKNGEPTFSPNANPEVRTVAGPRSGGSCDLALDSSKGYSPHPHQLPLEECSGDCDTDGDCKDGLKCFQQHMKSAVPGCRGVAKEGMDYCVRNAVV